MYFNRHKYIIDGETNVIECMTTNEYNRCVDDFSDGLYRFLLKNIGNKETAKDLVQESFMRLWEKRNNFAYNKSKTYLYTTAYHTLIDHVRKQNRNADCEISENVSVVNSLNYSDLNDVLNIAVERLPQKQKAVILLRDYEGYSYKEVGEITGLSETQVKVYIFRARTTLRKYIVKPEYVI